MAALEELFGQPATERLSDKFAYLLKQLLFQVINKIKVRRAIRIV